MTAYRNRREAGHYLAKPAKAAPAERAAKPDNAKTSKPKPKPK